MSKRRAPLWIYLVAGVSAVALVTLVVLISARTVQADAGLPRPANMTPAAQAAVATSPTPASIASQTGKQIRAEGEPAVPADGPTAAARKWDDKVHGVASWYGGVFNGRKTASGEVYDMYAMTACHATLPFGSIVRVVNRSNHRSVVVRITDRGDLVNEDRIIDLSYGAAAKLGMTWAGVAKVDLQVLSVGKQSDVRIPK